MISRCNNSCVLRQHVSAICIFIYCNNLRKMFEIYSHFVLVQTNTTYTDLRVRYLIKPFFWLRWLHYLHHMLAPLYDIPSTVFPQHLYICAKYIVDGVSTSPFLFARYLEDGVSQYLWFSRNLVDCVSQHF